MDPQRTPKIAPPEEAPCTLCADSGFYGEAVCICIRHTPTGRRLMAAKAGELNARSRQHR